MVEMALAGQRACKQCKQKFHPAIAIDRYQRSKGYCSHDCEIVWVTKNVRNAKAVESALGGDKKCHVCKTFFQSGAFGRQCSSDCWRKAYGI